MTRTLLLLALCACTPTDDPDVAEGWTLPPDAPMPLDPTIEAQVDAWLAELTVEEKILQLHGNSVLRGPFGTWDGPGNERLGIPPFRMVDGPRGVNTGTPTAFPVAIVRGASWDPALERAVGEAIALEAQASGANVLLAPAMNLLTHPAYGRAQEGYGEDPMHIGRMAVASTQGIQAHVMASAKHFAVNNIEDSRFIVDAVVDARTLHEVYLPHFREVAREADAATIMAAYNQVNGAFAAENPTLLTMILREQWGWQGLVVSDWVLATKDAKRSLQAGLDVEMPSPKVYTDLAFLLNDGQITEAEIDRAVRRVLRRKAQYALDEEVAGPEVIGAAEHVALARRAASAGTVLLKNDGVLPLTSPPSRVAVVGRLADVANIGDAGSSVVRPPYVVTPLAGLRAALGEDGIVAIPSDTLLSDDVSILGTVEVAVVVVGLTAEDEGENIAGRPGGDRETLALSSAQVDLIQRVAQRAARTVVVVQGGSAVTMEDWIDEVSAVLWVGYAGQEGGNALADLILGEAEPGGRLPFVIPRAETDLPPFDAVSDRVVYNRHHGYRHLDAEGLPSRFPFGHGLSYTSFSVTAEGLGGDVEGPEDSLEIDVTVQNTGARAGSEVVQLYVGAEDAALDLPVRLLAAFTKVELEPGASETVRLSVPASRLATFDPATSTWVLAPGDWRVEVATSHDVVVAEGSFSVR